ncbi:tetratricopeptide repeat protein [Scytonema sp. HK-05]|uniref:tetratricopeptide repeat protein n=1 Tax=Scytonema sp. HK-05 TaxID=1137095 RepID=UPI000AE414CD|nr:tetratricopeptide repeat protein [Scytonema sp. HK-05]
MFCSSKKRSPEALERYEQALAFYRDIGARLGEANTLQAIGDVLQFLGRSPEALERYEQALAFYRETGSRLGEANVLQEFGKLQDDPVQGLEYLQQAQNLYLEIGDIYSQSRNLLYFIADTQLNMGQRDAAVDSLHQAAELATAINYEPFLEYAQSKIAEIDSTPLSARGEGLGVRFQRGWVKLTFICVGIVAFFCLWFLLHR